MGGGGFPGMDPVVLPASPIVLRDRGWQGVWGAGVLSRPGQHACLFPSATPSSSNDTREQVLPAGQIVSKCP